MNIGDIAKKLDMPASRIRYYEKIGLLDQQQRVSGKRIFDKKALDSLRFIQLAQNAGFSLEEMKALLDSAALFSPSSSQWREIVKKRRQELQKKMEQIKRMDYVLSQLTTCKCSTLNECIDSCFNA